MVLGERSRRQEVPETQSMRQEDHVNDDDEELIKRSLENGSRAAEKRQNVIHGEEFGERMDDVRDEKKAMNHLLLLI